jgi:tRNA nucleotidyltransferase (CCA-adding enzyme)
MALSLNGTNFGEMIDPHKGERDLNNKLIRILHDNSFIDDATRMLRAIRYEQRFDFQIEKETEALLRTNAAMLNSISGDRIRHELELILKEACPEKMLRRAENLSLLKEIYGSLKSNGWLDRAFKQARSITNRPSLALYLSLFLYRSSYNDVEDLITKLKIPKIPATAVRDTLYLKDNQLTLTENELPFSSIYRLLKKLSPTAVQANAIATNLDIVRERLDLYLNKLRYVKISTSGDDLKKMGLPPGPQMGEIMRKLYTAELDQKVKTKKDEEDLVKLWLSSS